MFEVTPQPFQPVKISLVSLNSQYVHSSLAVWYLRAALEQFAQTPQQTTVVEGTINEREEAVLERILASRPDLLGFSCYIWNIRQVQSLLPRIKAALPSCRVVLGGPEVSYNAAELLEIYPEIDFIISGEGEWPLAKLLDAINGRGALAEVPGLCFRENDELHLSAVYAHENIAVSPFGPAYFSALHGRIAYIETSRGCPYNCAFCLSGRGEVLREVPLERAFEEILALARSGAQTIKFVDRTFNARRTRAKQILRFICEHYAVEIPRGTVFHFEIAGDLLDDESLEIVAAAPAGLFQFEIGLQSMHEATLQKVRRKTDMAQLRRQVERLLACGTAHVHLDLIAGLPEETLALFAQSFDEAFSLRAHALQLGFLKLIHGSAMRTEATLYPCRFAPEPPYEVQETPWLSVDDLRCLHLVERALDKVHNSGRFAGTLDYLTRCCELSPFALFLQLGQALVAAEAECRRTLSLEELIDLVFTSLCDLLPEQGPVLRDRLILDRLASTATSFLPLSLRKKEARLSEIKRALTKQYPREAEVNRAVAVLYPEQGKRVVFCDYKDKDPVTGLYPLQILSLSDLGLV